MTEISDPELMARLVRKKSERLKTLYHIVDKQKRSVNLAPNAIQARINACKAKRKMILKSRQVGITTNEVIKMLEYAMWTPNAVACVLAHEDDAIKKIFNIARYAYNQIPMPFRLPLDRGGGSRYEMRFPHNNSKIYCDLQSRGDTITWLHVSEAAFVREPERVLATMQTVPLDGMITLESTPNGFNWFYDYWIDDNGYEKLFFPWFLQDEYQIETPPFELTTEERKLKEYAKSKYGIDLTHNKIAFRRAKQRELRHLFIQEYPEDPQSCFLSSGRAAMDLIKVAELLKNAPEPIEQTDTLKIYEHAKQKALYVGGADTSEGIGGDFSVFAIFEAKTRRQVAVIRGQFKPSDFAHEINALCQRYEVGGMLPLVGVERNNHGHTVLLELDEHIGYPNLFRNPTDERLGWLTDRITRPIAIDTFRQGVENGTATIVDKTTLQECLTLVEENGKIEAETGKHDDCVMASAIALQLCIQSGSINIYDDIGKRILL